MRIIVLSCDKNSDIWEPFHHCMEKYYPGHPEVVYYTEMAQNPFYRTIAIPHTLDRWTEGLRQFLGQLDDDHVLLMVDDCFIRRPVDYDRIEDAVALCTDNVALMNFEKHWDFRDEPSPFPGWMKRRHGSQYEVSIMCGVWDRRKLMQVIEPVSNPWDVEYNQNNCGFDYLINSWDYIIDWGYKTFVPCNLVKGRWAREVIPFFAAEGIQMDYSKRGFYN